MQQGHHIRAPDQVRTSIRASPGLSVVAPLKPSSSITDLYIEAVQVQRANSNILVRDGASSNTGPPVPNPIPSIQPSTVLAKEGSFYPLSSPQYPLQDGHEEVGDSVPIVP
jgi:hypothetical protein